MKHEQPRIERIALPTAHTLLNEVFGENVEWRDLNDVHRDAVVESFRLFMVAEFPDNAYEPLQWCAIEFRRRVGEGNLQKYADALLASQRHQKGILTPAEQELERHSEIANAVLNLRNRNL